MEINFVFQIAIIIVSVVFHELSHGYAAYFLGDPTAKLAGRLTINPVRHLELFGSIIVPIITALIPGGLVFGWAKPVPYNPYNLRIPRWGEVIVAFAGPLSNLVIALLFSIYIRYLGPDALTSGAGHISILIVLVNITLAVFNMMPIPPLDGFKVFGGLMPQRFYAIRQFIESNTLFFIIVFIFTFSFILSPIISWTFGLFTGISMG